MLGEEGRRHKVEGVRRLYLCPVTAVREHVQAGALDRLERDQRPVEARGDDYVLKPMATDFTLSLGVAF